MLTNDERREVAAELRKLDVSGLGDERNIIDTPEEAGVLMLRVLEAINDYRDGLHYFPSHFAAEAALGLLADLIDRPTCQMVECTIDREELLKVADEIEEADVDGVSDWADRIRKAVGE